MGLRHHHFPTIEIWHRDQHSYLINFLPQGSDPDILALARHLGLTNVASHAGTNHWEEGKFRLFVSHLARHKHEAAGLRGWLASKSISAFVAHDDIEPTKEWQEVILGALASADAMAVLLRDGFHESNWTDQEVGFAVSRGILIIPIRLGLDPYGFIGKFQGINGRIDGVDKGIEALSAEIFGILLGHRLSAKAMADALVYQFEKSGSFADARANAKLLLKANYWNTSFTDRCKIAYENNGQINNANGVTASLEAVYEKWQSQI